jgi:Lon protease-like protein
MGELPEPLEVGLFPLPNVVLLPGATLPLQIFEPRYRAMVRDALESHALIAMALLRPGYEGHYYTNLAEIHPVVCLGRIREHIQIADGRYFINLQGACRARVIDEDTSGEYRLATLDPLPEPDSGVTADGEYALRQLLLATLRCPAMQRVEGVAPLVKMLGSDQPLGRVVDTIAGKVLPSTAVGVRQQLLELAQPLERARLLASELHTLRRTLEAQQAELDRWPRFGSMN